MASSKEYLDFILEQLSELEDISYRAMMGEYIIYYRGKVVGGIYDDRFLVKPTKSAVSMMPNAEMELPYEGAKEMLLVDDVDNREFLRELLEAMYEELPTPKNMKKWGLKLWSEKAEYCWLSYEPDNDVARQLYRSFGFEETGEMDGDEIVAVLKL